MGLSARLVDPEPPLRAYDIDSIVGLPDFTPAHIIFSR